MSDVRNCDWTAYLQDMARERPALPAKSASRQQASGHTDGTWERPCRLERSICRRQLLDYRDEPWDRPSLPERLVRHQQALLYPDDEPEANQSWVAFQKRWPESLGKSVREGQGQGGGRSAMAANGNASLHDDAELDEPEPKVNGKLTLIWRALKSSMKRKSVEVPKETRRRELTEAEPRVVEDARSDSAPLSGASVATEKWSRVFSWIAKSRRTATDPVRPRQDEEEQGEAEDPAFAALPPERRRQDSLCHPSTTLQLQQYKVPNSWLYARKDLGCDELLSLSTWTPPEHAREMWQWWVKRSQGLVMETIVEGKQIALPERVHHSRIDKLVWRRYDPRDRPVGH